MTQVIAPEKLREDVRTAQQQLDALRASLETRLAALEAAFNDPSQIESLPSRVMDLSRIATEEAQAAARRVCLETQLDAETRMAAVRETAQKAVDAERAAGAELRRTSADSEQRRAALDRDLAESRRAHQQLASALEQERAAGNTTLRKLEDMQLVAAEARRVSDELEQQRALLERQAAESRAAHERQAAALEQERASTRALQQSVLEGQQAIASTRAALDEARTSLNRAVADGGAALQKQTAELTALRRQLDEADQRRSGLERELGETRATRDQQTATLVEVRAELGSTRTALEEARSGFEESRTALENARIAADEQQAALDEQQATLDARGLALEKMRAALDDSRATLESTRGELDSSRGELGEARTELGKTRSELGEARAALEDTRAALQQSNATLQQSNAALHEATAAHEETGERLAETQEALADARAALEREWEAAAGVMGSLENVRRSMEEGEQNRARLEHELSVHRSTHEQLTMALERERADGDALRRTLDRETLTAVEDARASVNAEREETARLRQMLEDANRQCSALVVRERDARSEQEQLRVEIGRQQTETAQAMLTVAALQEELAGIRLAWDEEREALEARFQALDDQRIGAERALQEAEARYLAVAESVGSLAESPVDESIADTEEAAALRAAVASFDFETPAVPGSVRQVSRYALKDDIPVLIDGEPVRLIDVSIRGLQVLSTKALKPNSSVKIRLPLGDFEVAGRARVVWAQLEPPSRHAALRYRAGLRFTTIDETAITRFIDEYAHQPQSE